MLYTILYITNPSYIYNKDELIDLVESSKKWSNIHNVTGCLAYIEGLSNDETKCQFIQVLEGSKADVESILNNARLNMRLGKVSLIKEGYICKRKFNDWTMGIERINLGDHPFFNVFFLMNHDVLSKDGHTNDNVLMEFMISFSQQQIYSKVQASLKQSIETNSSLITAPHISMVRAV